MSEFHVVEVDFTDEKALLDALVEMGYKPLVHETPQNLKGYQGDTRKQKAHIILPKSQVGYASNDVGFEKVDGKYKLHVSEYDQRATFTTQKVNKLKQLYAKGAVVNQIKKKSKYSLGTQTVDADGTIRIRLKRLAV